jgi:hypothetical protein
MFNTIVGAGARAASRYGSDQMMRLLASLAPARLHCISPMITPPPLYQLIRMPTSAFDRLTLGDHELHIRVGGKSIYLLLCPLIPIPNIGNLKSLKSTEAEFILERKLHMIVTTRGGQIPVRILSRISPVFKYFFC